MKIKSTDTKDQLPRKKRRQLERKLIKAKRNAWHQRQQIPTSVDLFQPSIEQPKKKSKKKKKKEKSDELTIDDKVAQEHHRKNLLEDNEVEDAHIKKLEKLLGIKSDRKTYLRGFIDDGLDYLLDFCDKKKRKDILMAEGDEEGNAWFDDEDDEDQQWLKQKQRVKEANQAEEKDNQQTKKKKTSLVKFNEQIETKFIDDEEEEEEEIKEDIYGRTIDKKGNVIQNSSTYIPPALRRNLDLSDEDSNKELKRRLQGQFNRLSEANFSSILTEIENLYRTNSRAIINTCLYQIYDDALLSSIAVIGDTRLAEHALLASLLHANIGLEIGSFFFEKFSPILLEHVNNEISNKKSDNLILLISYFYAFHMTNGKIIFDIAKYLLNNEQQFNEKRLELILLLLKTIGFLLRKENPLELKSFLQELRSVCSSSTLISTATKRLEFMMDTIKSLKNNDVRKLPGGFQPERIDRLRKIYRDLIREKSLQQTNLLNVGLDDYLHVHERGRWWIVGSAWQKQTIQQNPQQHKNVEFNEKINQLAKQQHMNTEIRKLIFGTLLTSQDCDDAVEKIHKLNLNKIQEREIIHVTVHCCLHEKTYNPYYTLILQRFCAYDRRFQMSMQYHTWDRFKNLSLLNEQQLSNLSHLLSQLLISKSITLNIFKNFNFVELTPSARTFLVEIFVSLLTELDETSLRNLFEISSMKSNKFLREALRLFLSHFISKKSHYSPLIHHRCQLVIHQLSIE